ncbi:ABC transporter ATP-binding protein [Listeria fleischmannii FSL S10-1203]|uniref:ABC transporter ATP-binding protein n=1 Tax=Listeria fleischmannii FSL S10-1203 TaxID=1265822 RepID=W7DN83_9LIST|nr:ABC transporter ATP-binding protein [Listeria fleischmannii FSL S10-1203]
MQPKMGQIRINGHKLTDDVEMYRSQFSYIPETPILYEELTLREHLELTAMAYGLSEEEFEKRMQPLLKEFRLEKKIKLVSRSFF